MKLLFDQNISFRAVNKLRAEFNGSKQVRELQLENKSDREIWSFAKKEQFTIVSFDADFYDLVTLYGHPPKIIWLRMGNTSTDNLVEVLLNRKVVIEAFLTDANYKNIGCLEID